MTKLQKLGLAGIVATLACFVLVGGTSLWIHNIVWRGLALATSIGLGYLAYEFGDFLRAVPQAWNAAIEDINFFTSAAGRRIKLVRVWFKEPHPFVYTTILNGVVLSALMVYFVPTAQGGAFDNDPGKVLGFVMFAGIFWFCSLFFFASASELGEKVLGRQVTNLQYGDYTSLQLFAWTALGIVSFLGFFMWKALFAGLAQLVRIIHSSERLIVTVDGNSVALAAMAGYWYWGPASSTPLDYLLLMVFGSVLGMATVMVNVRYVAPRFGYQLVPQTG